MDVLIVFVNFNMLLKLVVFLLYLKDKHVAIDLPFSSLPDGLFVCNIKCLILCKTMIQCLTKFFFFPLSKNLNHSFCFTHNVGMFISGSFPLSLIKLDSNLDGSMKDEFWGLY